MNTCELGTLICIEYPRSPFSPGLNECHQAEHVVHRVGQFPGQNITTEPIHDGHKIHKATMHRDISDARAPDFIRNTNIQLPPEGRGIFCVLLSTQTNEFFDK